MPCAEINTVVVDVLADLVCMNLKLKGAYYSSGEFPLIKER